MTQTNIDYLFQSTGPLADRTYSAASAKDGAGRFDDHLSQASTHADDVPRSSTSGSRQTDSPGYSDWKPRSEPYADDHKRDAESFGYDKNSSSSDTSPRPDTDGSIQSADYNKPSADEAESPENDPHKANDVAASELAAAGQTASDVSAQKNASQTPNANTKSSISSKANAGNRLAGSASDRPMSGQNDSQVADLDTAVAQPAEKTVKLAEAANASKQSSDGLREGDSEAEQAHDADLQTKRQKSDKTAATRAKPKVAAGKDGDAVSDRVAGDAGSVGGSAEAAQKSAAAAQSTAESKSSIASNGLADADDSPDEDSGRDSRGESRATSRNDLTAPSIKAGTTAVANSLSNNPAGSGNGEANGKKNEQGVKPISAKSESVSASLTRLARPNATANGSRTASADDGPRVDPARFVGRVAKAFQTAQDRGGTLQLRLSPPELGSLRLELTVKDGVMSAALQTENANARRLLLDHLPALRDRLAEQNIRVDRFDVDVRREGTGSQTDARGSQHQQFQERPQEPAPRRQATTPKQPREIVKQAPAPVTPTVSDAGLNLIV